VSITPTTPTPVPVATSPTAGASAFLSLVVQPLGGILAFGLGVASFLQTNLHAGLGTPFGIALIVGGLGVYHTTVNPISA
jgi:hypothetical protein